jgi:hypothetical protein
MRTYPSTVFAFSFVAFAACGRTELGELRAPDLDGVLALAMAIRSKAVLIVARTRA